MSRGAHHAGLRQAGTTLAIATRRRGFTDITVLNRSEERALALGVTGFLLKTIFDAQGVFRAVMDALARPGTIQPVATRLAPPAPLTPELAAVALALAEMPVCPAEMRTFELDEAASSGTTPP